MEQAGSCPTNLRNLVSTRGERCCRQIATGTDIQEVTALRDIENNLSARQIDSSGIGVIVATCIALRRMGGDLKLLRPSGRVLDVLTVVRLLDVIPSFENEAQALASFRPRGYCAPS